MYIDDGVNPKMYYTLCDQLGSIVALVDDNGALVQRYAYTAFGERSLTFDATGSNNYLLFRGYTGHEHIDEFALINMNGRVYDPVIGRMLSPDNYVQSGAQGYNRYTYANNNPLKYTDPDGENPLLIAAVAYLAFTDQGYEIQKYFLPTAYHFTINFGSDTRNIGADASFGVPEFLPVYARANGGLVYHFRSPDHAYDNQFEKRYGYEFGATYSFIGFKSSVNYYDFSNNKFDQKTNTLTLGNPLINIKYENDQMFFLPSDGGDRYRTAAIRLTVGPFEAGTNLYTGDPGLASANDYKTNMHARRSVKLIGDIFFTYINSKAGDNPDEFRMGVAYVGIGGLTRLGINSESVRDIVQNQFAHDWLYPLLNHGQHVPHFAIDHTRKDQIYWNLGTGNGNSLW